ncbi:EcsC family protein [Micrococcus lylae]|uniref:EcsC family protein n=1 Tax=Micrococcus lylae TaxID=1273 RepID=UPI0009F1ADCF
MSCAGSMAADMAVVFSLCSRAVGRTALAYGYNPEVRSEQLFVLSVMNLSTAGSVAAKQAAMKDLAKRTHALAVKLPWAQIEQSLLARLLKSLMGRFSQQVTKNSLGKAVPLGDVPAPRSRGREGTDRRDRSRGRGRRVQRHRGSRTASFRRPVVRAAAPPLPWSP